MGTVMDGMTFEVVSTVSWNVLGTFDDEATARDAVKVALAQPGSSIHDVVVYVSDETGDTVEELSDDQLARWAEATSAEPGDLMNPLAIVS